jgi:Anion-transporting ATPase
VATVEKSSGPEMPQGKSGPLGAPGHHHVEMASILERKLIVVTGKGGVGKTTMSAAVGLLAARRGLRTIVVEVTAASQPSELGTPEGAGAAHRLSALLGRRAGLSHGVEVQLGERLWGLSIDRDRVLAEWLRALGGRVPARVLTSSSSFQYLIAAAPGAREMIGMVKLWELAQDRRPGERGSSSPSSGKRPSAYDLVVFDAPATGHALAMLRSPQTFSAIARVGPIARQAQQVGALLTDPAHSGYLAVAQATEMAITETLELRDALHRELGRELHAVVVNGALPRRFEGGELERIAALNGGKSMEGPQVVHSAARAARAVHERARSQRSQIARLRRGTPTHGSLQVLRVPFVFQAELDLAAVERIADRLERELR